MSVNTLGESPFVAQSVCSTWNSMSCAENYRPSSLHKSGAENASEFQARVQRVRRDPSPEDTHTSGTYTFQTKSTTKHGLKFDARFTLSGIVKHGKENGMKDSCTNMIMADL